MNEAALQSKKRLSFYAAYTGIFLALCLFVFSWFYCQGKSFVWKKDGLYQHLNSLMYLGEYLRGIFTELKNTGRLAVPLWEFHIGYGADIITTLHYYVLGDPLNLLAVFVSAKNTEVLYHVLIILRFYLAGIAFSCYCFKFNKKRFPVLVGMFAYIFCGYALTAAVRHPYFMNPMIYFPLVVLGIEKIYRREKPYLFIGMIFISAVSSFYFFYMITIFAVAYAGFRFFVFHKKQIWLNLVKQVGAFALYYGTGLTMACFIFVPVVLETLNGGRLEADAAVGLLYQGSYYLKLLAGFCTPLWVGSWSILGYPVLAAAGIISLFLMKKHYTDLKIGFVFLTILLLIPAGGYVLNGFSYVSNRWVWAYSFLVAYILTTVLPEWMKRAKGKRWIQIIVMGILTVNIILNAGLLYSDQVGGYTKEFHDLGTAYEALHENGTTAVKLAGETEAYRYEENPYRQKAFYNSAMQIGENSTTFYFSVANGDIYQFMDEMDVNIAKSFLYTGLDGRAALGALAGTKYFIIKEGNETYLPFGYEEAVQSYTDREGITYYAYENKYAIPFSYTSNTIIKETEYQKMPPIKKQQALMQGIVLEGEEEGSTNPQLEFTDQEAGYTVAEADGVTYSEGEFLVTKKEAEVTLVFEGQEACENYLHFNNIRFHSNGNKTRGKVTVKSGGTSKPIYIRTPENQWYEEKHNFLVNTGYSEKARNKVTLKFDQKGTYTFDSLQVICQPMEHFPEYIERFTADSLDNLQVRTNKVSGDIDLKEEKVLCLSIPYSSGWSVYVDGKRETLVKANTMYMAVKLDQGRHAVELRYTTPGLKAGLVLAGTGVILLVGIVFYQQRRKRKGVLHESS